MQWPRRGRFRHASAGTRVTQRRWWWSKPARNALKIVAIFFVFYFFILPLIPGFRRAVHDLQKVNPALLLLGLTLELAALGAYSMLTRAALPRDSVSVGRMLRIQLSTAPWPAWCRVAARPAPPSAIASSPCPGSTGPDAGFALATAGLGSAVVLNIIFWTGLLVSIPVRGVNPFYGTAAIIGLILVTLLMFLVIGLLKGQARAERILRSLARRFRFDEDQAAAVVRQLAARLRDLASDPKLLSGVIGWATANWLLDVAALVGVPAGLRRQRALGRADRGLRPGQHPVQLPHHAGRSGHRGGHLHPHAGGLRAEPQRRHAGGDLLPPGAVLAADPARRAWRT